MIFDPEFNQTFTKTTTDPKWWDNGLFLPMLIANEIGGWDRLLMLECGQAVHTQYVIEKASYIDVYRDGISWVERLKKNWNL